MASKAKAPKPAAAPSAPPAPTVVGANPHTDWSGTLAFGIISVPVKLRTGPRAETISFRSLHSECLGRLNQQGMACKACNRAVTKDEIVKGFEYRKGQYVTLTAEEIKAMAPETQHGVEIETYVPPSAVDPALFESTYYVDLDGDLITAAGVKAYHLMRKAMIAHSVVGLAKLTMGSREHLVVVRPYREGIALSPLSYLAAA